MSKPKNVTVGHGPCPLCGASMPVKANKHGRLYVYCAHQGDGGCNNSSMSRSDKADGLYAARITKWSDPAHRAAYLGGAAKPAPATAAKPAPAKRPAESNASGFGF